MPLPLRRCSAACRVMLPDGIDLTAAAWRHLKALLSQQVTSPAAHVLVKQCSGIFAHCAQQCNVLLCSVGQVLCQDVHCPAAAARQSVICKHFCSGNKLFKTKLDGEGCGLVIALGHQKGSNLVLMLCVEE